MDLFPHPSSSFSSETHHYHCEQWASAILQTLTLCEPMPEEGSGSVAPPSTPDIESDIDIPAETEMSTTLIQTAEGSYLPLDVGDIDDRLPDYFSIQDLLALPPPIVPPCPVPTLTLKRFLDFLQDPWIRAEEHAGLYSYKRVLPVIEVAARWGLNGLRGHLCSKVLADEGTRAPLVVRLHAAIRYTDEALFKSALDDLTINDQTESDRDMDGWNLDLWIGYENLGRIWEYKMAWGGCCACYDQDAAVKALFGALDGGRWEGRWDVGEFP